MHDSISIIGGSDGPTEIYIAGNLGASWLNLLGLLYIVLLMIPNIIYAILEKDQKNLCTNRFMNVLEQIGRYGCMFFMIFNIGILEFDYGSIIMFLIYFIGNLALMMAYWIIWAHYFKKKTYTRQIALAVIPSAMFLLSGITMRHYLLVLFGIIFAMGHLYVTNKNRV